MFIDMLHLPNMSDYDLSSLNTGKLDPTMHFALNCLIVGYAQSSQSLAVRWITTPSLQTVVLYSYKYSVSIVHMMFQE